MNRYLLTTLASALLLGTASAQISAQSQASGSASQNSSASANSSGVAANSSSSANASQNSTVAHRSNPVAGQAESGSIQSGSTVQAELTKPVDAKKNKPGDPVVAKTTQDVKSNGRVVIPRGSKIVGHVTEAKARAKGQQDSSLGLAFDHAVLKDGSTVPVSFAVQAIGNSSAAAQAAQAEEANSMESTAGAGMSTAGAARSTGGGLVGGVGATAGGVTRTGAGVTGSTLGSAGGAVSAPLTPASRGVVGMPNLTLVSAAANSSSVTSSTLTSSTSNVHLDSGTEMILRADNLRANQ